jgi:hypothetical protein
MTWNVAGTLATLFAALAAGIYTWLTYRLVRALAEPHVIVYAHHDESRPTLIQIVIENIGHGLATDLTFTSSQPLPHRAFGVSVQEAKEGAPMSEGPLITGIPSLAPGETRKMIWGQFGGLHKALGGKPIKLTCNYFHGARHMPPSIGYLEVHSFEATDAAESDAAKLVGEVKRLADAATAIQRRLERS